MNIVNRGIAISITALVMLATGCASTHEREPQHQRAGEYVDDSVLTAKVKAALFNEPNLKSAEINVETFKGVVQLSGFVGSWSAKRRAADVARHVEGVRSVKNDMRVK
jgi:osmotically-inducible protein OsmY